MIISLLPMLFDICYLAMLCAIILFTFCGVFLPSQPAVALVYSQSLPMFQHTTLSTLPAELAMLCAIGSLLYLKCIWRLICR